MQCPTSKYGCFMNKWVYASTMFLLYICCIYRPLTVFWDGTKGKHLSGGKPCANMPAISRLVYSMLSIITTH